MGKIYEIVTKVFNGGIENDPRDPRENTCRVVSNFDILTNPRKLTPYRDSESGDSSASTSRKQAFITALRTGTTYSLYALGVKSGDTTAEVLYKNLTTGAADDLDDATWAAPSANQSASGATDFDMFVWYKSTSQDLIFGSRSKRYIWAFSPSGTAWADTALDMGNFTDFVITDTSRPVLGLVHSKDNILYVASQSHVFKNNNSTWTSGSAAELVFPLTHFISATCEYGNFIAFALAPKSGVGSTRVYLWDRNSSVTTLTESIDFGEGEIRILEELDGYLIGISLNGSSSVRFDNRITFKYYAGAGVTKFKEIVSSTTGTTALLTVKQKINNRLHFAMRAYIGGAQRDGVWSIGKTPGDSFSLVHERTPNNDTALSSGVMNGFFIVGDYVFISYQSGGSFGLSKTNDASSYVHTSIWESKIFDGGDSSLKKKLLGVTVNVDFGVSGQQVIFKYKKDDETTFTTINASSESVVNIESTGATLPEFQEIQFRIESTGGVEITGFSFKYEVTGKRVYD